MYDPSPVGHPEAIPSQAGPAAPRHTFAENAIRSSYVFPGHIPFIARAAERLGFANNSLRHQIHSIWFVTQAANNLGNACFQRDKAKAQESVDLAMEKRDALAVALAATEAMILETTRGLGLADPPFAQKPEKPEVIPHHGPRKLRRSVDPGE